MNVSIIGSGYVGLTTALALAQTGSSVILLDVSEDRVVSIREGRAPFYEPGVEEFLSDHIRKGSVRATMDYDEAINGSDITFLAVGTPMDSEGRMDASYIKAAARSTGEAIARKGIPHIVVVKSTVLPGTTEGVILPILKDTGAVMASIAMCPEFLREGSAMEDALHPDRVVIGCSDDTTFGALKELFEPTGSRVLRCDPTTAEMIKYASNSFLATKISFANEISRICEITGIDVYEVMEGVGMDSRISPQFLRAGVGFGGSCFPKDVSALIRAASDKGMKTPLLDSVMLNNEIQPVHLVDVMEVKLGVVRDKRVLILGLAFKPDTDDVRETRSLPVARELSERGAIVGGHDPQAGPNFAPLMSEMRIFKDLNEAVDWAEVIVLMTEWPVYRKYPFGEKGHLLFIFDGRRTIDPDRLGSIGYWAMGSPL